MAAQHNCVQDLVSEVTFRKVENMLQVTCASLVYFYVMSCDNVVCQSLFFFSVYQCIVFQGSMFDKSLCLKPSNLFILHSTSCVI